MAKTKIRTHYYNPPDGDPGANNFGDMLVPIILEWLGYEEEFVARDADSKLLCIGSEMTKGMLRPNDVVWGYGAKYDVPIKVPEGVKFGMVRGPMTHQLIQADVPEVFGDPASLMPLIYKPKEKQKRYRVGIIPHYVDKRFFTDIRDDDVLVINISSGPYNIIDEINACDLVISTSLHGCIVAEAYGKPVIWKKVSNAIQGLEFKWNDYIMNSGREATVPQTISWRHMNESHALPTPIINTDQMLEAWRTIECQFS